MESETPFCYLYHFSWRDKESHSHSKADSSGRFAERNRQGLSSDK